MTVKSVHLPPIIVAFATAPLLVWTLKARFALLRTQCKVKVSYIICQFSEPVGKRGVEQASMTPFAELEL